MTFNAMIGGHVRQIRQTRWMTLPEVAKKAHISKGTLSKIENGKGNPTIETLVKLAKALEVETGTLLRARIYP